MMRKTFRFIGVPLLILLYGLQVIPLGVRQAAHKMTVWLDHWFDVVAGWCGWDTQYWPLPKASDEPLPQ